MKKTMHSLISLIGFLLLFLSHHTYGVPTEKGFYIIDSMTISQAGNYYLADDLEGFIGIEHDDVVLDLNGRKLTSSGSTSCIIIGSNKNITIRNGILTSGTGGSTGISATDSSDLSIVDIKVQECGNTGIFLTNVSNSTVENTIAINNKRVGFNLNVCKNCFFRNCKAIANGGTLSNNNVDRYGFVSEDGCGNIFQDCCAEANTIPLFDPIGFCRSVAGFAFIGDEHCSKIINCKSENNWAPFEEFEPGIFDPVILGDHPLIKSATPYGILLKPELRTISGDPPKLELVTAVDPTTGTNEVKSVSWSPDGKYLAVGGQFFEETDNNDLHVYYFDGNTLTLLASTGLSVADIFNSVSWSPDGKYIAVGVDSALTLNSTVNLHVYTFDPQARTPLTILDTANPSGVTQPNPITSVDWSPDGKFLAAVLNPGALYVYSFDPAQGSPLALVQSTNPDGDAADNINSVAWSPNGKYLASGGNFNGTTKLFIQSFTPAAVGNKFANIASIGASDSTDIFNSVDWSPDGCFLAVGGDTQDANGQDLRVYSFDPTQANFADRLALLAAVNPGDESASTPNLTDKVFSVDWSADGKYLAMGGKIQGGDSKDLRVYSFDSQATDLLILLATVDPGGSNTADTVRSVAWSPDGQFIAMGGGVVGGDGKDLRVYHGLDFPTKNVIKHNIVACNCLREDATTCGCDELACPKGVGICGTSICNMIMENQAYNNPFNYQFVTNVFDQRFGFMPSLLQNIALGGCEPVLIPNDLFLLRELIRKTSA